MKPERLSAADLFPNAPFRVYHTRLAEPYPLHWHDFYELTFIVEGRGRHTLNGQPLPLERGTLFLLSPVDFHSLRPDPAEPIELFNLILSDSCLDDELRRWLFTGGDSLHLQFPPPASDEISWKFRAMHAESESAALGRERMIRSLLESVLVMAARRSCGVEDCPPPVRSPLQQAIQHLHHHFRDPLSLKTAAAQASLAPAYFSRKFHQTTGITFQRYLSDLRLRFAASLLLASDLPVTEIGFTSGFRDAANFGRAFRAKFGIAPGCYREQRVAPDPTAEKRR